MRLTEPQKASLLEEIREILPGADWASNEAWIEEGQNAKKPSEPVDLERFCDCIPHDPKPATITIFLRASLSGQHFNVVGKLEAKVREWVKREKLVEGCGICNDDVTVDLRLFRMDKDQPRFKVEDEVDNLVAVV